ncbi:MAG: hypothetical protein Q7S60_01865 [bacterium]|nr:hypothetical protein [bacterium]
MSTLLSGLVGFLAFFFSAFIFWRRCREDYAPGKIFSFTLILLVGGAAGSFGARLLLPPMFGVVAAFWLPFILVSLLTLYLVKKLDLRLFEVLDSLVPSVLFFIFIYTLGLGFSEIPVGGFDLKLSITKFLIEAGLGLFGLVAYRFFQGRYRRFSWYPSGKVGFLGLATLTVYFFARFLVAILFLFGGAQEAVLTPHVLASGIISLILSFFFLLAVYLRSGRVGAEKLILKWSNLHFR